MIIVKLYDKVDRSNDDIVFLFDYVLTNNDLDRTYAELRELIVRIQHDDQQWIRACYRRT